MYDACVDDDEVATEIARRWAWSKVLPGSLRQEQSEWRSQVAMDKKIFLGPGSEGVAELWGKL